MTQRQTIIRGVPNMPANELTPTMPILRPGDNPMPKALLPKDLQVFIQRHLLQHQLPVTREVAERTAVVQGKKGTGKTLAVLEAILRYGWCAALVPMSDLSGKEEGKASERLKAIFLELEAYSKMTASRVVFVGDDAELSVLASDEKMGFTVNKPLLEGDFQKLADAPKPYRNHDGGAIPLILTGNDLTSLRSSLLRDGRAVRYTHAPTADQTLDIVMKLFDPDNSERRLLEKVFWSYSSQPIAFWASVKKDLLNARLDKLIADGRSDAEANKALSQPLALEKAHLWAVVKARADSALKNHL